MADVKLRIIAAAVIIFQLFLLLLLWLILRRSFAFFLTGSIDVAVLFVILAWSCARLIFLSHRVIGVAEVTLVVVAAAAVLATVGLSCLRRCSVVFYTTSSVDLALALALASWAIYQRAKAVRIRRERNLLSSDEEEEEETLFDSTLYKEVIGLPRRFRYRELKAATQNFRTPIGRGGSGSVFKGFLGGGADLPVAVKRIEGGGARGDKEFRSEITSILSAQHVNLVPVVGYCLAPKRFRRFLVYKFYENGSLESWIFPGSGRCLSWSLRYRVAVDVARALAYLHHDCRVRVLHLDVKPENILLDEGFRAHVTDFGISKLMDADVSKVVTTMRGTSGYLAPEWFVGTGISEKCDVYSYGMVLLELVGGRRNARFSEHDGDAEGRRWSYFPKNASEKVREGKVMEAVDERLRAGEQVEEEEVRRLVYVALWCIQDKPELRPSMATVVAMLQEYVAVVEPPETQMFLVDRALPSDETGSPSVSTTTQSFSISIN
ncbi:putative receptor-like protein kinase At5g20050 [Curcuma longa]|uniref:putative receptor-like protein kinase At5g20050 n=1 Tax=Curcuma longa TaxID=136217 RepID=UPI003D9E55B5